MTLGEPFLYFSARYLSEDSWDALTFGLFLASVRTFSLGWSYASLASSFADLTDLNWLS